ncbi:hypothetical protein GJR96_06785 [Haloferax sp. MBLA0076]|uniref:DUF7573 domain-containing protein n=1 Tax=Haloferax litoreum TaxID=2666140 RepID=A0A6A8GFU6_9EURY|nr:MULTISPECIES: hypothetical protein [Haloferax]KAB1193165.1 hypothetical protein Hfx1148_06775 [Haloferax sp. CBA1148]MRX21661.1 hypothetical protein [Haloferax litoreum]
MPNRSLDDFATGSEPEDVDAEQDSESESEQTPTADDPSDDVDTLATYRWTPTGTTCPQCGESVEKTWLDEDEYVCAECKNW